DAQEKEFGLVLQQALSPAVRLEQLTKSTVDVFVYVLECDGTAACLAAAITCASLAIADAGIEMLDQVVACSSGLRDSTVTLDCTGDEEAQQLGSLVVSYMPSVNEVTHLVHYGETSSDASVQ
ncbi:Exosome complex component MTR3, partial [Quaeritorhiza haematococci]